MNNWMRTIRRAANGSDRRRSGRLMLEGLFTDRGPVLDLSRGGMRLMSTRKLTGTVTVRVFSHRGTFQVTGSVAWTRRNGFRQHEIGLRFHDVSEELQVTLLEVARAHGLSQAA